MHKVKETPSDSEIPTIAAVLDPAELARQLNVLLGWNTSQGLRLRVLRWKKANRCTFEMTLGAAGEGVCQELIGKVYAEDRSDVYRVMEEITQAGFGAEDKFAIPQPVAFLPSLRLLLYEKVSGASVRAMIVQSDAADRARAAEQSARWLARFHARAPRSGPVIHVHDQFMSSERAWRGVADLGEPFADKVGRLFERLSTAARGLGPIELCAGHGMYTPGQVLLADGGRRTVTVDWDTYQVADPSHDVARFLVSLKRLGWRCFGSAHALDAAAEVFLKTYVAAAAPADITARLPFQEAVIYLERAQRDAEKQKRELAETMLNEALVVLARWAPATLAVPIRVAVTSTRGISPAGAGSPSQSDTTMRLTTTLPDDPALPGLAAIRAVGLARAIPALGLEDGPVELLLCGYTPGDRATLEARAGQRRFAVKAYVEDPASEAGLYQALGAAALPGETGVRVPPLLAWERDLRVLVLGWLEGPTAEQLFMGGQGARAGELAARWLERAATLRVNLGPPMGAPRMLLKAGKWVTRLRAADPGLGAAAAAVGETLEWTQPNDSDHCLVHGTFYARHILDVGGGPGVIDWQRFGQGPLEFDAGTFLATITRLAVRHPPLAGEAAKAEGAFRARTRGLLDEQALAWYRTAALLRFAAKPLAATEAASLRPDDRQALELAMAQALLDEAARPLEHAARPRPIVRAKSRASFIRRRSALELVLQALSTRPATPAELDEIRRLLDETNGGTE